jgi:hypothetical protein
MPDDGMLDYQAEFLPTYASNEDAELETPTQPTGKQEKDVHQHPAAE